VRALAPQYGNLPSMAAGLDLSAATRRNVRRQADKVAVEEVPTGRSVTFGELERRVSALASALLQRPGIKKGDRIAMLSMNCIEYCELYLAAARAGLIAQGINWRLADAEIARILASTRPTVIIVASEFLDVATFLQRELDIPVWLQVGKDSDGSYERFLASGVDGPAAPGSLPNDPVLMMSTGGSTGVPKGVVHTNRSLISCMVNNTVAERIVPSDRYMLMGQMFHSAAVLALNYLYNGATLVMVTRYDTALALDTIEERKVTAFLGFTTMMSYMLAELERDDNHYRLDSLRNLQYGGGPYAAEVIMRIITAFRCGIIQNYGTTEHVGVTFLTQEDHDDARAGRNLHRLASGGHNAYLTEVALLDEEGRVLPSDGESRGQVFVRSQGNMLGYWERPEETAAITRGEWLGTGDIGVRDHDGYLYIVGRAKDMIISGSENIYAAEVERAIAGHPGVMEAAVIGVPDETWGEAVAAFVVCKDGQRVAPEAVADIVTERLGSYQKPRHVWFIDEIPRSPNGKVLKQELRLPADHSGPNDQQVKPSTDTGADGVYPRN
jgi:acyl-CoA synthetase (AMP-forming)/AMP-acid ligase II